MSFNREKYEYFFPSKVYRCVCVANVIQKCFDEGSYSLVEIVDEINNYSFFDKDKNKVFSIKWVKKIEIVSLFVKIISPWCCSPRKSLHVLIHQVWSMQPFLTLVVKRRRFVKVALNTI